MLMEGVGAGAVVLLLCVWAAIRWNRKKSIWNVVSYDEFMDIVLKNSDHDTTYEALKMGVFKTHRNHVLTFRNYASRHPQHGEPVEPDFSPQEEDKDGVIKMLQNWLKQGYQNEEHLYAELEDQLKVNSELRQACRDFDLEVEDLRGSVHYYKDLCAKVADDRNALAESAQRIDKKNQSLVKEIAKFEKLLAGADREVDRLQGTISAKEARIQGLITQLDLKEAKINDLVAQNLDLIQDLKVELPAYLKDAKVQMVASNGPDGSYMPSGRYNNALVLEFDGKRVRTAYGWADVSACVFA